MKEIERYLEVNSMDENRLNELKSWLQKKQEYYEEYHGIDYLCSNKEKEIKIQDVIDKIEELLECE